MKIRLATWNLDHASNGSRPIQAQIEAITNVGANILVLTETCESVNLSALYPYYEASTTNKYGKNYSAIWSRWPVVQRIRTYDDETAVCTLLDTPIGNLLIYGTILTYHADKGSQGTSRKWEEHNKEITRQGDDWYRLQSLTKDVPMIVAGDFNQTRDGSGKYCSPNGIQLLDEQLNRNSLFCVTDEDFGKNGKLRPDPIKGCYRHNIDHICITKNQFDIERVGAWDHFVGSHELSDHNGVFVDLVSD